MRIVNAIRELTLQGYSIKFELNPMSNLTVHAYFAVTMSAHGINVRGNIEDNLLDEDHICAALQQLSERLELEARAISLKSKE